MMRPGGRAKKQSTQKLTLLPSAARSSFRTCSMAMALVACACVVCARWTSGV